VAVIVGFDYWQVLSHYPEQIGHLIEIHERAGDEVHVISAIGSGRIGTVESEVRALSSVPAVHEVVFRDPRESPYLKLAKCQELGIELFYDDRDDVCRVLNKHGILAVRVTRRDGSTYDLGAERT
jgi:acid phosphatase class B